MKIKKAIVYLMFIMVATTGLLAAEQPIRIDRIVFAGSSITVHTPSPIIGWTGNWGMAATTEEKDYAHIVLRAITEATGKKPEAMIENIVPYERAYKTYNLCEVRKNLFQFKPNVVVFAIGENVPDLAAPGDEAAFKSSVSKILHAWRDSSNPVIFVRSTFWTNPVMDDILQDVCEEVGGVFVDIHTLSRDKSNYARAEQTINNPGVASHPGDKGMEAIARAILEAMEAKRLLPSKK